MIRSIALAALVFFVTIQYSSGLMRLERSPPTAICWSLAPSYGELQGGCSHAGGVMLAL
jgi:hypothetical protein